MNFRQVHLDFHTSEKIDGIGANFKKEEFQAALKAGHVNSITVFSKCHHGWAYHPSDANEMHPGLSFDLLAAQIEAAHEIGVKTPVYLSAGYDEKIAERHPEWLRKNKADEEISFEWPGYHRTCFNTPYLDYLLAQIREVVERYDADGIFLDIVGVIPCRCESCVRDMKKKGLNPEKDADVLAFAEEVYANYLKRTRETIDAVKPGLPLFHNSGHIRQGRRDLAFCNSHLELESLPTGGWGYDHFPMSARYVQNLGMEYLGMTGKFHTTWGEFGGYKHPNALRYEAALSAAHGAKCSIGDQLPPDGKMDPATYALIGAAYSELEEKEAWLDDVTPVCDVALLSGEAVANSMGTESEGFMLQTADTGAGRILIEGKYQFSVVDPQMDLSPYKVLILPDTIQLSDALYEKIKAYVKNGGKLLATGASGIADGKFLFDFGVEWEGEGEFLPSYIRMKDSTTNYIMYQPYQKVKKTNGTVIAEVVEPYFNRTREHFCSHQHAPASVKVGGVGISVGNDGAYIAWKIFSDYAENGELIAKTTVLKVLDALLGEEKVLKTSLGSQGVATLMKQDGRYVAHLLYAVPTKRGKSTEIIEDIYPVYGVKLEVKVPEAVKKVYLAPQMTEIPFRSENGYTVVEDITVDCHQMLVFEF